MKSVATLSAAAALLCGSANAFWRMPCHSRITLARLDPIVNHGEASTHAHVIHGGSNFDMTTTYDDLRDSDCTSCQFDDDKSAYWTAPLMFVHDTGEVEVVEQVGGMLAYYLLYGDDIKAFPKGFQMLAGDTRLRNFTGPVPDPPTSSWGPDDTTQFALGQKSIGMNCMNYNKAPEGSRYRHFTPDKSFLDQNCVDGIRAELMFPSCWNGKDATASDHKSHMAYPNLIDGGSCPDGFPVRVPTLFYETIWNTYAFKGKSGQFVWGNGDPTGYGYHGDFMMGWKVETLQAAVTDCTNPSGLTSDCPHFNNHLQSEDTQGQCKIQDLPHALAKDDCAGPAKGLCGNVPIQYGPGYANALKPGDAGKPAPPTISSVAPVPTLSYAPARSMATDKNGGGISVYNVKTDAAPAASSTSTSTSEAPVKVAEAPAPPAITPAPKKEAAPEGKMISTSTYTSGGVVYEVAIEEIAVTVTVTEDSYKHKHRRHAHHRRQREHGLLG